MEGLSAEAVPAPGALTRVPRCLYPWTATNAVSRGCSSAGRAAALQAEATPSMFLRVIARQSFSHNDVGIFVSGETARLTTKALLFCFVVFCVTEAGFRGSLWRSGPSSSRALPVPSAGSNCLRQTAPSWSSRTEHLSRGGTTSPSPCRQRMDHAQNRSIPAEREW